MRYQVTVDIEKHEEGCLLDILTGASMVHPTPSITVAMNEDVMAVKYIGMDTNLGFLIETNNQHFLKRLVQYTSNHGGHVAVKG